MKPSLKYAPMIYRVDLMDWNTEDSPATRYASELHVIKNILSSLSKVTERLLGGRQWKLLVIILQKDQI